MKSKIHLTGALIVVTISCGLMYCWLYILGGIKGIEVMHSIDKSILDGTSLLTHTSIQSIIEETVQQLLVIFGNYLQYLGFRLHEFWMLLLFPFLILFINFKTLISTIKKKNIYFLVFIVCSSIIYAAILAVISGHTSSFHARYSIFVIPFSVTLIAASVIFSFHSGQNKIKSL